MLVDDSRALRFAIIGAGMAGHPQRDQAARRPASPTSRSTRRRDRVGGTWRENTYPGLACDVPSHLYSYSFAPNPEWSHRFSPGDEIQAYFEQRRARARHRSARSGSATRSSRCRFDDGRWHLETDERAPRRRRRRHRGHRRAAPSRSYPDIDGPRLVRGRGVPQRPLGSRRAASTARASASSAPARRRCRSSSALVDRVAKLSLFQRTAQWIMPQENPAVHRGGEGGVPREPGAAARSCTTNLAQMFGMFANAVVDADSPEMQDDRGACASRTSRATCAIPELRERAAARLPRGVQAADHLARLLRGDPAAERRARHRGDRAHRAERRAHRATVGCTSSTCWCSRPASRPTRSCAR